MAYHVKLPTCMGGDNVDVEGTLPPTPKQSYQVHFNWDTALGDTSDYSNHVNCKI